MRIMEKIHIAVKHNHRQKAVGLFQGKWGMTINLLTVSSASVQNGVAFRDDVSLCVVPALIPCSDLLVEHSQTQEQAQSKQHLKFLLKDMVWFGQSSEVRVTA